MELKQKITSDLKEAMKSGDSARRDTLRMLESMIKNSEIEKKKKDEGLSVEEIEEVITRAVKQRKDSISQYESAGRTDLAEKEKNEVGILMGYMPEQMSEEDVRNVVKEIITKVNAVSKADIGKVMGPAMGQLKGKADGNLVKKIVEEELK